MAPALKEKPMSLTFSSAVLVRVWSLILSALFVFALSNSVVFGQTEARNTTTNKPTSSAARPKTDVNPAIDPKYTTPLNALDAAYGAKIKEYTTEKYFLTELVDHLPASDTVPSPEKILGYAVGTPNKLTHVADLNKYYRALAAASPRVRVFTSKEKSEEGRE